MKEPDQNICFLLADDHSLIRQGLMYLLGDLKPNAEVLQASSLGEAEKILEGHAIDIAVIDALFPEGDSLHRLKDIRAKNPNLKILIYSGIDEEKHALNYLRAGANGFISKLAEEEELENALRSMLSSGEYLSPLMQSILINSLNNPQVLNPLLRLTPRELHVAELYAQGLGNLEIANHLQIKQNTVSTLKKRVYDKLEIETLVELITLMREGKNQ